MANRYSETHDQVTVRVVQVSNLYWYNFSDLRGNLVWAKLEGFPWWPAVVCDDPELNRYRRTNKQRIEKTHVQFFDIPPSRAWVPAKLVSF